MAGSLPHFSKVAARVRREGLHSLVAVPPVKEDSRAKKLAQGFCDGQITLKSEFKVVDLPI